MNLDRPVLGWRRVRHTPEPTPEPLMRALPAADYDAAIAEITALLKASSEIERYGSERDRATISPLVEHALRAGEALQRSRR